MPKPSPVRELDLSVGERALMPAAALTTNRPAPDGPDSFSYERIWGMRAQYDSLNVCALEEFVTRRLAGRGLEGCDKGRPLATAASGAASAADEAIARARAQVASEQPPCRVQQATPPAAREASASALREPPRSSAAPKPAPPRPPAPATPAPAPPDPFVGYW